MELAELLDAGRTGTAGAGGCPTQLDLDGTPVFAKRIALTDRELTHPRSTASLFDLPMFCQYGIGSPGFNAWRDLSAAEHDFARRNSTHDAGYAAMQLTNWLVTAVCGVPVPASSGPTAARNEYVLACATGNIPDGVPPTVAAILRQHAAAGARMNSFYWKLFGGEVDADYLAHTADGQTP